MATVWTERDFDRLSWHDCHIRRIDLVAGDADEGDRTSDLALGLDVIVEWLCGVGGGAQSWIAPATLVFHGVTDPRIAIDWGHACGQVALHPVSIDRIQRERLQGQKVYLGRAYYRWRIVLNWPVAGEITFGAVGFMQTLLAEPVLCGTQQLSPRERSRLLGR